VATLTSKTTSGSSTGAYRIADDSDHNINSGEFQHSHSGKDGIGTIVHIFDVSSLSGNRTYVFQHNTTAQTLNTSATITAIVLYDGSNQLTNDVQQLSSPLAANNEWESVAGKTGFSLPASGGIYVAASIQNQKTSGGSAVVSAEWVLQYKKTGDIEWKNLNYPIFRAPLGEQIGMVSLVGALPNNTEAGNYDFRVAHRRITDPSEHDIVTQACNMVVVGLGYENGYFPILTSTKPSASTTSTTLVSVMENTIKPQSNTDIFVHTQYALRSNGTTDPCTHDLQLKKRGIEISKSISYLKYIANDTHRCSGSASSLFPDMVEDSLYNIDFRHASRPGRSMTTSETYTTMWGLNRSSLPFVSAVTVYATEGVTSAAYNTLKAALDDVNSGIFRGEIIIHINDNTIETAACEINASGTGNSDYSSILVYPTSSNLTISGNTGASLIHLKGAENITIDGRVNQIGEANLSIINQSTSANARAIRFENSAQNNTFKYLIIKGSSTGDVIFFSNSSTGDGNNDNIVEHCQITNAGQRPGNLIYSAGTAGRRNSGNIIRNNSFYNFLSTERFSYGINIVSNSENWVIDGNHFYDTEIIAPTDARGYSCIRIYTTDAGNYTISNNYFGGTAPYCAGGKWTVTASTPHYMRVIALNTSNSETSAISNNTIQAFEYTSTGPNPFDGIYLYDGTALMENNKIGDSTGTESIRLIATNPYLKANISAGSVSSVDIIGAGTGFAVAPEITFSGGEGSGATAIATINAYGEITEVSVTNAGSGYTSEPQVRIQAISQTHSTFHGIWIRGSGTKTIRNNIVGSIKTIGSNAFVYGFEGIYESAGFLGNTEISNNTFGSLKTENNIFSSSSGELAATGQRMYGIYSQNDGNTTIKNNTVGNIINAYTGNINATQTIGIYVNRGNNTIENNSVSNIKTYTKSSGSASAASICGISVNRNTAGLNHTIKNNKIKGIYNLNPDARVDAYGIFFYGSNADWSNLSGNLVQNIEIQSSHIGSSVDGIVLYGGKAHFHNNIIHLGKNFSNKCLIYGIWDQATWTSDLNCYFNTVIIEGSVSGETSSSFAFYNRTSTGTDRNVKNNLFINTRSGGTTGKHYAIRVGTVSNLFVDYNNYFAPNGVLGWLSSDKTTLAAWKAATSQDINSYNEDPQFTGIGIDHEPFYPVMTQLGATNTGIATDYTGQNRSESSPKIGALEINEIVWQGGTNTDFNTGSNWIGGIVPDNGASIRFAESPDNHCVLDQNRVFGSFANASGKNFVLNGHKATIGNSINFSSTGQFDATETGSVLELNGETDQMLNGNSFLDNSIDTLVINNSAQVNLSNNLSVNSLLRLQNGTLALNNHELSLQGKILTVNGQLTGGNDAAVSIEGDIPVFAFPGITLKKLSLNTSNGIILSGNVTIQDILTLGNGYINVNSKVLTINGFNITRTNGTINASDANSEIVFNNQTSVTLSNGFFNEPIANLIISFGGLKSEGDITITETIDLQSNNPNSTTGLLSMLNGTEITLSGNAQILGIGDITGIVIRNSFAANIKYSFGNSFTTISFIPGGTYPSNIKCKISIGTSPVWKPEAISRIYDFIQQDGVNCFATIATFYLDAELNGNNENELSQWTFGANGQQPNGAYDWGFSNSNTSQNWVEISNVNIGFFPTSFGNLENTLSTTTASFVIWNGSVDTDWEKALNWTPNYVPTTTSYVVIPDANTTSNDPILPGNAEILKLWLQPGSVLNSGTTSTFTLNGNVSTWVNSHGTFNPADGTVIFSNTESNISGKTQFYNLTIPTSSTLWLTSDAHIQIQGTLTNNGTLATFNSGNTIVEYNGGNQTIVVPKTSANRYSTLILSGTGTKTLASQALEILGNFEIAGTSSVTGAGSVSIDGNMILGTDASFATGAFDHSIKGNFENNGTFYASITKTFAFNGIAPQFILGNNKSGFGILELNNSLGLSLLSDVDINNELKITSGVLYIGEMNLVINLYP